MLKLKKTDLLIILILILSALLIYFIFYINNSNSDKNTAAEILINGKSEKIISLLEDKTFSIETIPNIKFEIKDKKIRFMESDCPDKICVNTGFIGTSGQTAVCLPNTVSVKIIPLNNDKNNLDIIAQ